MTNDREFSLMSHLLFSQPLFPTCHTNMLKEGFLQQWTQLPCYLLSAENTQAELDAITSQLEFLIDSKKHCSPNRECSM